MAQITLTESQLNQLIQESIEETLLQENIFTQIGKAISQGWKGAKQGYQDQARLDNAEKTINNDPKSLNREWTRQETERNFDPRPWVSKPGNTAEMEANEITAQIEDYKNAMQAKKQEYQETIMQYKEMIKQLTAQRTKIVRTHQLRNTIADPTVKGGRKKTSYRNYKTEPKYYGASIPGSMRKSGAEIKDHYIS